jgi:hypothetical protein
MGLNEDILRFLNIQIGEVEEGPSIMMQAKTERSSRSPREQFDVDTPAAKRDENKKIEE